ncbi:MAG: hypothetical protein HY287_11775 [Planctomycetes bacterium]|nr:hypothetical protein [Planctomycetota bacterium]
MRKPIRNKRNLLANSDFAAGRLSPSRWRWTRTGKGITWKRLGDDELTPGIEIVSCGHMGRAAWYQDIASKPGADYRVEADVDCDLTANAAVDAANDEGCGFTLQIQPAATSKPEFLRTTPFILKSDGDLSVRAYYQAPKKVRKLRVSVAILNAIGRVKIRDVRCIPIIEPEEESHLLAFPPPTYLIPPSPLAVRSACIFTHPNTRNGLIRLLSKKLGPAAVSCESPTDELSNFLNDSNAVFFPDDVPPSSFRTLIDLQRFAEHRVVVISLRAFASLTRGAAKIRTIRQSADPIHARVDWSNHVTAGFALHDAVPFASRGNIPGSFSQTHIIGTPRFSAFCKKHHLVTLLSSICESEAASHHPVALACSYEKGAFYVIDLDVLEDQPTTFDETHLAKHIALGMLGRSWVGLGQYSVPPATQSSFADLWRDMPQRIDHFRFRFAENSKDVPSEVTIGEDDGSLGLLPATRPIIRLRTGFAPGDVESFFGAWCWFKQLLGVHTRPCPYAGPLLRRFRPIWSPACTPWDARRGWNPPAIDSCGSDAREAHEMFSAPHAAIIDLVARRIDHCRVILHPGNKDNSRFKVWIPQLYRCTSEQDGADRSTYGMSNPNDLEIGVDDSKFDSPMHKHVIAQGGLAIRIETPWQGPLFVARSIEATEQTASLIEHVVGLVFGLILVNRRHDHIVLDDFEAIAPGHALILDLLPSWQADHVQLKHSHQ